MKTISLLQPWASLVIMGVKTIETRLWQTAYRGPLLIHASKGKKGRVVCNRPLIRQHLSDFNNLPFGAIIGSVTLTDIVPVETLHVSAATIAARTLEEKAFGDDTKGRYAWFFSDPVPLETPIITGGSLGLWDYYPQ
ncbi:ASCH domain-containing protein [Flavisolibacter sp. BT320]|nr:ASCH domain-containing protein [Flavisolibacter longurius]